MYVFIIQLKSIPNIYFIFIKKISLKILHMWNEVILSYVLHFIICTSYENMHFMRVIKLYEKIYVSKYLSCPFKIIS